MTSSAPFSDRSLALRVLSALAHALIYVLVIAAVTRVASWFHLLVGVNQAATFALVICWMAAIVHRVLGTLCVQCMKDVPADAPVRAERYKRLLRFAHFSTTRLGILTAMGIYLAPLVVGIIHPLNASTELLYLPTDVWFFAVIYTEWQHHRLRPWCPYCRRWDDGGDHEPAPDPTASNTTTLQ